MTELYRRDLTYCFSHDRVI